MLLYIAATVNIDENYPNLKSVYQVTAEDPDAGDSLTVSSTRYLNYQNNRDITHRYQTILGRCQ